jgi:hypothetical protein
VSIALITVPAATPITLPATKKGPGNGTFSAEKGKWSELSIKRLRNKPLWHFLEKNFPPHAFLPGALSDNHG